MEQRAPALTTITGSRESKGQNLLRPIMSMKQRFGIVYLLCGLDGPSRLGSAFKHSKAKHSKARARLHCVLDFAIVGSVPTINDNADAPRIESKNSEHFEGFTMIIGQVLRLPGACLSCCASREVCHITARGT